MKADAVADPEGKAQAMRALCDALAHRSLCLFLGAGANATTTNTNGDRMPVGNGLARLIAAKLLNFTDYDAPLDQVAAMAEHRVGREDVDTCVATLLNAFKPAALHFGLTKLPFESIYTTNYDTLVERAFAGAAAKLTPIFSADRDISSLTDDMIPYYKLHGCVDNRGEERGRLTLTIEDYRIYDLHRRPLFKRLQRDLETRTFLFVGYSLRDQNFVRILDDCRAELDIYALPRSYAVLNDFHEAEAAYWREKYNVHALKASAEDFVAELKETWLASSLSTLDAEARQNALYFSADEQARFRRIGDSFFMVDKEGCTGTSDPQSFFKGRAAAWADVRDDVPAERDDNSLVWELAEEVEAVRSPGVTTYAIVGAAGTGKTTLCKSILWSLIEGWSVPVVQQIPGTVLDASAVRSLVARGSSKRIFVYVPFVEEQLSDVQTFLHDLRHQTVPATVILEERSGLWASRCERVLSKWLTKSVDLAQLSQRDIEAILEKMATHGALGKLEGVSKEEQISHFELASRRELLVALRELTERESFDDLVRSEYQKLPSKAARDAYALVCTVGQMDQHLRYEVLRRILKVPFDRLEDEIFRPTHGVLMDVEERGASRYNHGYRLRTRHPLIASIVFDTAAPTDDDKFALVHKLLTSLDLGFPEDRQLLHRLTVSKKLVETIGAPHRKRGIYELLAGLLPNDAYVSQHRSMLEKELHDPDAAIRFAKKALAQDPGNHSIKNTLGLAYEAAAREERNSEKRKTYLEQAEKLFGEGIAADPRNAYGYIGMTLLRRNRIRTAGGPEREAAEVELIEFLEDACEATANDAAVVSLLGEEQRKLGDSEAAIAKFEAALVKHPNDSRVRDNLSRMLAKDGAHDKARDVLTQGLKTDPTAWRLHRNLARLLVATGAKPEAVRSSYEAAIRFHQGDPDLIVEYASYLFQTKEYQRARQRMEDARKAEGTTKKRAAPAIWRDTDGKRRIFRGSVRQITGQIGHIAAAPEGFEARFGGVRKLV